MSREWWRAASAGLGLVTVIACSDGGSEPILCSERNGVQGQLILATDPRLAGSAAEFYVDQEPYVGLVQGVASLPSPLEGSGYRSGGFNTSEDIFMYVTRAIDGLVPNGAYRARFCATAATPLHAGGIGQRQYMKLGASTVMPSRVVEDYDYGPFYFLNVDKGRSAVSSGANAVYAGELGQDGSGSGWGLVTREPAEEIQVNADSEGRVWLLAGVDSTFGGRVDMYWLEIEVELTPAP